MARTRVIIADTDIDYIIPLQLKFAEEFFDKIDLEIITDRSYFEELFASPQEADVLVVSEELYDAAILRHNIGNIFVLTEQPDDNQTAELNVNRIYKYTSIKEVFIEITGQSQNVLSQDTLKKTQPQIIVVTSASGGTGKTTIALGLAACLTQNYKRVLYINAAWMQSFQRMLENDTCISSGEVYTRLCKAPDNLYEDIKYVLRKEQFTYLPPFKAALISLGLDYSVYGKIALSAKKSNEFDYVIVDADTEFDEAKASLMSSADRVLVITRQSASSVYATNRLVDNINGINSEKYMFICNDFDKDEDNALISPKTQPKFTVNEYVDHIAHYDSMKAADLAYNNGISKVSILLM